jgi:putative transposase
VNEKWLLDITEHSTNSGKLYLCAIMDCSSRRIVGYSIDARMKSSLAVNALRHAVNAREPINTIVHSDRGSQFRSKDFTSELTKHGLRGSMGRVGAAGDNAAMESFFALLQKNVLNRQRWETREDLRLEIVHWIEATYHRRRRKQPWANSRPSNLKESKNWPQPRPKKRKRTCQPNLGQNRFLTSYKTEWGPMP